MNGSRCRRPPATASWSTAPPDRALRNGDRIAFTVRPEKLRVVPVDEPVPYGMCTAVGTVIDVVYQGVSTQLVVRTDEGTTLVAFRQNSERVSDAGTPGTRARLLWHPEFNVVLTEESSLDTDRVGERPQEPVEEELTR